MKRTFLPLLVLACIISVPLRAVAQKSAAQQTADNLVDRGNEKAAIGDFKEAILDYKQALNFKPNYRAYFNLGVVYCHLGNTNAEISYFTQASEYNPKDPDSWIERGIALNNKPGLGINMDDIGNAIASINQGLKLNPTTKEKARAYWGLGQAKHYWGLGPDHDYFEDLPGELADFNRAIQLDPTFPDPYFLRANDYVALAIEQPKAKILYSQKAIADYSQTIKLSPYSADAYENRSFAYEQLGNKKAAIADLKTAANIYYQHKELAAYREAMGKLEDLKKQAVSYY